jgi:hypothetical protein
MCMWRARHESRINDANGLCCLQPFAPACWTGRSKQVLVMDLTYKIQYMPCAAKAGVRYGVSSMLLLHSSVVSWLIAESRDCKSCYFYLAPVTALFRSCSCELDIALRLHDNFAVLPNAVPLSIVSLLYIQYCRPRTGPGPRTKVDSAWRANTTPGS